MRDLEDELAEIKREIIESRAVVIKNSNQTGTLGQDVRAILKRQVAQERRLSFNIGIAATVFVVAVLVVLKLSWDVRADATKLDVERRTQESERLKKEALEIRKREDERARAELKAAQFYELIRQGKRQEIIDGYDTLKKESLSRVEQGVAEDAYERARTELAHISYEQAKERVKIERYQEAATLLEQSLKIRADGAIAVNAKLQLAQVYRKLRRCKDAIVLFSEVTENSVDKEPQDDAAHGLAYCHMETESWNEAKNAWRELIRRFPDSRYVGEAKMQLASLNLLH
ncbi:MAG: outer membrane protein assembly factor BamD [Polyangiaceae bacterium]|nr:outer membrane protein assembly factor BamD [Polyangiaceae bacterium]